MAGKGDRLRVVDRGRWESAEYWEELEIRNERRRRKSGIKKSQRVELAKDK